MAPRLLFSRCSLASPSAMLALLKNLFGKKAAAPVKPAPAAPKADASRPADGTPNPSSAPKPQVAVAQLSLAAIIDKFPEELRTPGRPPARRHRHRRAAARHHP